MQHPVALFDFNSLYPSVILQSNICCTTLRRARGAEGPSFETAPIGLLPSLMSMLLDIRETIQGVEYGSHHNPMAQKALSQRVKLLTNSVYTCLYGRWSGMAPCPQVIEAVTLAGRRMMDLVRCDPTGS